MIKRIDIIDKLHPKALLPFSKTHVIEFDNKFDLLGFLKKHSSTSNLNDYMKTFYKNLENYEPNHELVTKIKNQVLNNLLKRGIITGAIYEGFTYEVEGEIIDHAMLASGNPACMMKPVKIYDKYFYELYINMSVPGTVSDEEMETGAIKLIETIKALEARDIEIKINIVDYSKNLYINEKDIEHLLLVIPLVSHLEHKDYANIMPFILSSFLRGPSFMISRNSIDNPENVKNSMGSAYKLKNTVNLWDLDEVELAERILGDLDLIQAIK